MAASAGVTAAMAAAAAKRRREEEEEMTRYTDQDLQEGWEFKIVHSNTGAFKKPGVLRQACEEEAQAGWILLEKFDDSRLRFKRPAGAKRDDSRLSFDPYRTTYGMSDAKTLLMIFGVIIGLALAVLLIVFIVVQVKK